MAIYASETWSLTKQNTKKMNVFENNCLCAILNIRLLDHVSIKEIRKRTKQLNPTESVIWKRHLTWFGHVCRMRDESAKKNDKSRFR